MKRRKNHIEEYAARDLADLTIRPMATGAQVYVLRFNRGWGWAIVVVHDETGFFGISSDHGNWSFTWAPRNIGCATLHEFLSDVDPDYIVSKLLGSRSECVSIDRTQDAMREEIIAARREGWLAKETARERWKEVDDWGEDELQRHELPDWLGDDRYEIIRMAPTIEAQAIEHIVWPAARLAIRQEVARRGIVQRPPRTPLLEGVHALDLAKVVATPPEEAQ